MRLGHRRSCSQHPFYFLLQPSRHCCSACTQSAPRSQSPPPPLCGTNIGKRRKPCIWTEPCCGPLLDSLNPFLRVALELWGQGFDCSLCHCFARGHSSPGTAAFSKLNSTPAKAPQPVRPLILQCACMFSAAACSVRLLSCACTCHCHLNGFFCQARCGRAGCQGWLPGWLHLLPCLLLPTLGLWLSGVLFSLHPSAASMAVNQQQPAEPERHPPPPPVPFCQRPFKASHV